MLFPFHYSEIVFFKDFYIFFLSCLASSRLLVVNTYSITSSRTYLSRYNQSATQLNQDLIPGPKCHTSYIYIDPKWWGQYPTWLYINTGFQCFNTTRTQAYLCNKLFIDPKWWGRSSLVIYQQRFQRFNATQGN